MWRILVPTRPAQHLAELVRQEGFELQASRVYVVDAVEAAHELLGGALDSPIRADEIEVLPRPGVTDRTAEALQKALQWEGAALERATVGWRYRIVDAGRDTLEHLGPVLANTVVEVWSIGTLLPCPWNTPRQAPSVEHIPLGGLDADGLVALSSARRLSLDLTEMQAIQRHFGQRAPTDLELEMLAQTWSEHCTHKTFRATVHLGDRTVCMLDLLKEATAEIDKPWVRSAFVDNAGIVAFDEHLDVAIKVETHNRPSALEPFGGAHTGVGGCIRDILGVSARPFANTDVLCFAPAQTAVDGLSPERIAEGVTAGIEDYGNKMGIPTVAGAVVFDAGYRHNPLVFVGCVGVLPHGSHPTEPQRADHIVVLGGRTGRDGLRGATFSSMQMAHDSDQTSGSAVQIGHPLVERQVQQVVCDARDAALYHAITDCGAGGLSSAVGEMASALGARVHLESVPTKYPGLAPWEIWLSEAQERMVMAVPAGNLEALQALCALHQVEATPIGQFTGDGIVEVLHHDQTVGELPVRVLHEVPPRTLHATEPTFENTPVTMPSFDARAALLHLLSSENGRTRAPWVRRFDHEVQGGTIVRPLVGQDGPGDGAVLVPREARLAGRFTRGVAIGCGINPFYADPYRMAWAVVDEAIRNVTVVGADPDQISLLDNFCWGDPKDPVQLGRLVRCVEGCRRASILYGTPWVSGKDSLNNSHIDADGTQTTIPGTLLVTALGIVPDIAHTATSDLKEPGNVVLLVGASFGELGGSALFRMLGREDGECPRPMAIAPHIARAVHRALRTGAVRAAHDVSEGGLAVALAEMAIGGRIGLRAPLDLRTAFCETSARYLLTVRPEELSRVRATLCMPHTVLGETGGSVLDLGVLHVQVDELVRSHRTGSP